MKNETVSHLKKKGLYKEGDKLKVDPKQLGMGIKVELEHTDSREAAKQIALDHLAEDPEYYTKLKKIEGEDHMKKSMGLTIPIRKKKALTSEEVVHMPSELQKAKHLGSVGRKGPEHKGKVQGAKNPPNTVPPREPTGGSKGEGRKGAPVPESSKKGSDKPRVPGRKPVRPPYLEKNISVSGMKSDAVDNYLNMTDKKTGEGFSLKLGSAHRAEFDHTNNLVGIVIDGKRYPVQNHLVKLPSGVYKIAGMVSVANKVIGQGGK